MVEVRGYIVSEKREHRRRRCPEQRPWVMACRALAELPKATSSSMQWPSERDRPHDGLRRFVRVPAQSHILCSDLSRSRQPVARSSHCFFVSLIHECSPRLLGFRRSRFPHVGDTSCPMYYLAIPNRLYHADCWLAPLSIAVGFDHRAFDSLRHPSLRGTSIRFRSSCSIFDLPLWIFHGYLVPCFGCLPSLLSALGLATGPRSDTMVTRPRFKDIYYIFSLASFPGINGSVPSLLLTCRFALGSARSRPSPCRHSHSLHPLRGLAPSLPNRLVLLAVGLRSVHGSVTLRSFTAPPISGYGISWLGLASCPSGCWPVLYAQTVNLANHGHSFRYYIAHSFPGCIARFDTMYLAHSWRLDSSASPMIRLQSEALPMVALLPYRSF